MAELGPLLDHVARDDPLGGHELDQETNDPSIAAPEIEPARHIIERAPGGFKRLLDEGDDVLRALGVRCDLRAPAGREHEVVGVNPPGNPVDATRRKDAADDVTSSSCGTMDAMVPLDEAGKA